MVAGVALTACTWMAKRFYGRSGRRIMDDRLAPEFIARMTRRYGFAGVVQIAAVAIAIVAPRVGVAIALLSVAFFLLPQPKPRYKAGEAPSTEEKPGRIALNSVEGASSRECENGSEAAAQVTAGMGGKLTP